MHIGLYSPTLPDTGTANGIVTYVRSLRVGLESAGHRVTVVAGEIVQRPDRSRLVIDLTMRDRMARKLKNAEGIARLYAIRVRRALKSLHQLDPFDIFEVEESFGLGHWMQFGAPQIVRLHGPHFLVKDREETVATESRSARREMAEGRGLTEAAAVSSPSSRVLALTQKRYGFDGLNTVIPNPIASADPADFWSVQECNQNQVLCVGRFDHCKGADLTLHAFNRLVALRPQVRLIMVGPDRGINGLDFNDFILKNLSPEARSRVSFRGTLEPSALRELRKQSGCMLVNSRFETFSYSAAEALSVGMPLVASEAVGIAEYASPGVNLELIPAADVDGLVRTLVGLLGNTNRLAALGSAGRELAEGALSLPIVTGQTLDFYRSVRNQAQRLCAPSH